MRHPLKKASASILFFCFSVLATAPSNPTPPAAPSNRVASLYVSQDFINEQLAEHAKSDLVKSLTIFLDPDNGQMFLRGVIQVPVEELRAINLDPKLAKFLFQVSIHPRTTRKGHLILEFPLDETFFYPASSKNPKRDRVVVPVQMLSLALASVRGYLAALSGDFAGFDRRTVKLQALIKALDRAVAQEKNPDAKEELQNERESLRLRLAAVPVERKQLQAMSKQIGAMLGFTGEKELSLNEELGAQDNALILKIKLSQLAPYLNGVELGGVRILHDKKDGQGQNYLAVDIDADLAGAAPAATAKKPSNRPGMKVAPSLIMRLNQALFESDVVVSAEKKQMGSKITDFDLELKEDGIHVSGKYHAFLFTIPFETVVDANSKSTDQFEVSVAEIKVGGIDFEFLNKMILETMKKRLDQSLKGICSFEETTRESDHAQVLRVTVDPKKLIPALPDMHLVGVDIREREFLLKLGRT